jgi:hypothetical protein
MASKTSAEWNWAGVIGLVMVSIATLLSPSGFLVITLPFLALVGFGGLLVCLVSLAWRPRWPGVVGLVVGIACVAGWAGLFLFVGVSLDRNARRLGLDVANHTQMCMSAQALIECAESQRTPTGSPAASVVLTSLTRIDLLDPWNAPYRYVLTNTPRGFTFMSDGADGLTGTPDDIDLSAIQFDGTFPLPPISGPAAVNGVNSAGGAGSGATKPQESVGTQGSGGR